MNLASLFNLAGPDLLVILLIVLLLFGAKKLPELLLGMADALRKLNDAKDKLQRDMTPPRDAAEHTPAAGLLRRLLITLRCMFILTLVI